MAPREEENDRAIAGDWGLCRRIELAATERLMEEWRGKLAARRRKAEENSLTDLNERGLCLARKGYTDQRRA